MSDTQLIEKEIIEFSKKHHILPKHTDFQIEHFMIGKECTTNAKIWQCVREINSRNDILESLNLEIDQTKDNLELAKIKLESIKLKKTFNKNKDQEILNKRKKEIIVRKQERVIFSTESNLLKLQERKKSVLLECKKLIEIFHLYNPNNDVIDIDSKESQIEYWNRKLLEEVNLNTMLGMPVGIEVVRSILALPDESQVKKQLVNAMVNNGKKLIDSTN